MKSPFSPSSRFLLCLPALLVFLGNARATYLDDIGYTALAAQLQSSGTAIPDGNNVSVVQVEAATGTTVVSGTTYYQYIPTSASYSGVTFTYSSTAAYPAATSWHADMVGQLIYGNTSMGSGISQVAVSYVNDWLGTGYLNYGFTSAPKTETSSIVNHSWVGSTGNTTNDANILRRFDYSIERDDYIAVVGIQNSGTVATPNLLSGAYNVISAGVTDGTHMSGTSSINSGVTYPHLVVPVGTTSEATAVISSAAALLIQTGSSMGSANAMKSETIKAVLLASATKDEIPGWSHTSTTPLDTTYGAGELNIQLAYDLLTSGEQTPSANPNAVVSATGWDDSAISLGQTSSYYFDLAADGETSIALTWNAIYSPSVAGNYNTLTLSLANLSLALYEVQEDGSLGSLVAESTASTGNIEYIWATGLDSGSYAIQVVYSGNTTGSLTSVEYAVAWQSIAVPEPSGTLLALSALTVLGLRHRRKWRGRSSLS